MILQEWIEEARRLASRPGHRFADFAGLFADLDAEAGRRLLNELLGEIRDTPKAEKRFADQPSLHREGDFHLGLTITGGGATGDDLCASEFDLVLVPLADAPVPVPLWRTGIDPDDVARRPGPLESAGDVALRPYEPRVFSAYREIVDLASVEDEVPFVVVHSEPRGEATWVFDRRTHEPLNLTANKLRTSRVQMALRVLGALGDEREADRLEEVARSDQPSFVRWQAAESLYAVDPDRATRLLGKHLVRDADPSIRRSSAQTLENIFGRPIEVP